ncbi:ARM repeat-containing protein [Cutaneotrichosporon oleaginosum]|uniref:ARM repeat-containing protein n=1 Tax=Cutaneotrichosporon oleaginosum TaxID=879819 RepID=A0A0J0XJQ9_9TREE|nr:ARM repeat-containing protein [Cutaneotrichosporon oleaginosum]KLT41350.1 ARM repeat-containing protein [Cutaneotrichosporon oleaginosum]TXT06293.1 hypothetical protein COLE_05624 [Cutaneotrichosporon oleaginosum]
MSSGSDLDAQVISCLQATLDPHEATRRAAEEQLKSLYQHPEGGLSLTRILADYNVSLPQRQSAGILLQKYIDKHWSACSDAYEPPATPSEAKAAIRPMLLRALSDRERKVRTAAAFACSTVARSDWPDDWPTLLSELITLLQTGSPDAVHGAMRVVTEFVKNELSEDQLVPVVRDLVPALLSILGSPGVHSFLTRAETVAVYRQVVTLLEMLKEEHPQAVRQALNSMAPVWFDAFTQLLSVDAAVDLQTSWESLALRIRIFRVLLQFQTKFPRYIAPHIPTFLRLSILNLTSLLPAFNRYYVSSDPDSPDPPIPEDSYQVKMDLDDLASAIFEYLEPTVRSKDAQEILLNASEERGTAVMETIVGLVLTYTQVTRQQEEEWLEDANAFVEDEDEDNFEYSLRIIGHDLMGSMIDKWPRPVGAVVNEIAKRRVHESAAAHASGNADWWKPLETMLGLLGGIADDLTNLLEQDSDAGRQPTLDLAYFFDQVIPSLLVQTDAPFLQGRAFVFASQFASPLSDNVAQHYLNATVEALSSENISVPVKISAVKTIRNFCRHVDSSIMSAQAPKVLSLLLPVLWGMTNETLYLILETIHSVVSLDKAALNAESTNAICEHVYNEWLKNTTDPIFTAITEELVESIASSPNPSAISTLVNFLSPRLAELITQPVDEDTLHVPGEAIQLANAIVRPRGGPLEAEYIGTVTVAVMKVLEQTDDMEVIQRGMLHLTYIVRKDCDKLIEWHAPDGTNGIARIFGLLGRFLAPTFSESGGIFVGDLVMHLFRKAGSAIAPVLGDLLSAMASRLATAQTDSFIQSMIIPFAYLFGTEYTEESLALLQSFQPVTVGPGQTAPALDLVLQKWSDVADTITGSWNIRVNDLGLCKLFSAGSPALNRVRVKGDLLITDANRNRIMTRSRTLAQPNTYSEIPFPIKALKLLLKDVQVEGKGKGKSKGGLDVPEDDGDEEWDDDDLLAGPAPDDEFALLSDWLDAGPNASDAQDDDEDLKADPLAQIDMGEHITETLRSCYASNANGMHEMVGALSAEEKGVLQGVLTL